MDCVTAQDGGKGLHTHKDNSILGKYFRERLGLPSGEFITRKHLDKLWSRQCRIQEMREKINI